MGYPLSTFKGDDGSRVIHRRDDLLLEAHQAQLLEAAEAANAGQPAFALRRVSGPLGPMDLGGGEAVKDGKYMVSM